MDIKKRLSEELNERVITKLDIFDFDGTLVDTPLPVMVKKGKGMIATSPEWEEKTGNKWPHIGWWGRMESLNIDVFEMPTIDSVISAYKESKANPNALTVMLTGRMKKLGPQVKAVLDDKGLTFDMYLYNDGGETSKNKIKHMGKILDDYPSITTIEMWDDRDKHIPTFQAWGDSLQDKKFKINHVLGEHHGETP